MDTHTNMTEGEIKEIESALAHDEQEVQVLGDRIKDSIGMLASAVDGLSHEVERGEKEIEMEVQAAEAQIDKVGS